MTTFREIPGYPNYLASENGLITKLNNDGSKFTLSQRKDTDGYLRVNLRVNGIPYTRFVHQLVALAFIEEEPTGEVNHKDGVKTNNKYTNLEWCTRSDNMSHAVTHGLKSSVLRIRAYNSSTGEVIVYPSMKNVLRTFGMKRHVLIKYLSGYPKAKYKEHITFQAILDDYIPNVREGRQVIMAYDYVSNRTLVADTPLVLSLLTGIQTATIKYTIKNKKMNLIGGYVFKTKDNTTPFPTFTKDLAKASREHYMLQYE